MGFFCLLGGFMGGLLDGGSFLSISFESMSSNITIFNPLYPMGGTGICRIVAHYLDDRKVV
jgi:hypothetical protein